MPKKKVCSVCGEKYREKWIKIKPGHRRLIFNYCSCYEKGKKKTASKIYIRETPLWRLNMDDADPKKVLTTPLKEFGYKW